MTGSKASERETITDVIIKHKQDGKKIHGLIREGFAGISSSNASISGIGSKNVASVPSGFLNKSGDSMLGPFAVSPSTGLSIQNNNTVDIGVDTLNFSSNMSIIGDVSNTLDRINGFTFDGQLLYLRTTRFFPIIIRQGTAANLGNIQTSDESDLALDGFFIIALLFDANFNLFGTGGTWRVLSVSSGGGGGNDDLLASNNVWTGTNTFTGSIFSITSPLIFIGDESTDKIHLSGRINTNIIPFTDGTFDLGSSNNEWGTVYTQIINATTSTTILSPIFSISSGFFSITSPIINIGDQITDEINFFGRANTNFLPITDGTLNLGSSNNEWDTIYTQNINASTSTTVLSPIFTIASSTMCSIISPSILLGDQSSDNISFLGQVNTNMVMEEISLPGAAPANTGRFYPRESGGVSVPFWKDENNNEFSMIAGAIGTSDRIVDGDSSLIVTDDTNFTFRINNIILTQMLKTKWFFGIDLDLATHDLDDVGTINMSGQSISIKTPLNATDIVIPATRSLNFLDDTTLVAGYDGPNNNWGFSPVNDLLLGAGNDIVFTPGSNDIFVSDNAGFKPKTGAGNHIGFFANSSAVATGSEGSVQIPFGTSVLVSDADANTKAGAGDGCMFAVDNGAGSRFLYVRGQSGDWMVVALSNAF